MVAHAYSSQPVADAVDLSSSEGAGQVTGIGRASDCADSVEHAPNRVLQFIAELRRRRVCRAATVYVVTLWLIAQVIDVVSEGFGLPPWTIKAIVVIGLAGFPIALALSWLFDITPEGQVRAGSVDNQPRRRPIEQAVDCGLLLVALVIGTQLAFAALSQPAEAARPMERVTVEAFRAASGDGADVFSIGLATEIQHMLVARSDMQVVAGDTIESRKDWCRVSGSVAMDESHIRVAVTLIDGKSGAILWSQIFEREKTGLLADQAELAEAIMREFPGNMTGVARS